MEVVAADILFQVQICQVLPAVLVEEARLIILEVQEIHHSDLHHKETMEVDQGQMHLLVMVEVVLVQ